VGISRTKSDGTLDDFIGLGVPFSNEVITCQVCQEFTATMLNPAGSMPGVARPAMVEYPGYPNSPYFGTLGRWTTTGGDRMDGAWGIQAADEIAPTHAILDCDIAGVRSMIRVFSTLGAVGIAMALMLLGLSVCCFDYVPFGRTLYSVLWPTTQLLASVVDPVHPAQSDWFVLIAAIANGLPYGAIGVVIHTIRRQRQRYNALSKTRK
jgi:hypothetical protein